MKDLKRSSTFAVVSRPVLLTVALLFLRLVVACRFFAAMYRFSSELPVATGCKGVQAMAAKKG
jgi:hypothetical protein